jgi:hypothetical protein
MPKFMETKQIIHIASEIVVLVALTVYFTQKNKRLSKHIQELAERLEQQEDVIQRHEQVIRRMVDIINSMGPKRAQSQSQPQHTQSKSQNHTKKTTKHSSLPQAQITIHTQDPSQARHAPTSFFHTESNPAKFNPLAAIFGGRPAPRPSTTTQADIEEISDSESEHSISESESEDNLDADLKDELGELSKAAEENDLKSNDQEDKENGEE